MHIDPRDMIVDDGTELPMPDGTQAVADLDFGAVEGGALSSGLLLEPGAQPLRDHRALARDHLGALAAVAGEPDDDRNFFNRIDHLRGPLLLQPPPHPSAWTSAGEPKNPCAGCDAGSPLGISSPAAGFKRKSLIVGKISLAGR